MSQTVLVVEDDRELGKLLLRAVTGAGYLCELVGDGQAAFEKIQAEHPSVVLLDLLVPKKDGRAILRELSASSATSEVPVIAMSGVYRGRSTARELSDAGAQSFLEKPFSTKDLIAHLHAVIGPPTSQSNESSRSGNESSAGSPSSTISLEKKTPAQVFWDAMSSGFSGAVQFSKGKTRKVVLFERGVARSVRSNAAHECLGHRLMSAGKIDREELQESLKKTKSERLQQGQALVAMGAITERGLSVALLEQAEDKLLEIFEWQTGKAWYQKGVSSMSYATPIEPWTPRTLIFRGVARMATDRVKRVLKHFATSSLTLQAEGLSREEAEVPGIAPALAASEAAARLADVLDSHAQALFGLWACGNLVLDEGAAVPTESSTPDSGESAQLRATLAELSEQNYFEILGVKQESAEAEVQRGYLLLAKKYHPDKYQDRSKTERAAASDIFTLLSTVYDTLQDLEKRREYVAQLKSGSSEKADLEVLQRILGAEQKFSEAESLFKRRAYGEAAGLFKEVLDMEPEEAEYNAYYGWCQFLARGNRPEAAQIPKQHLQKALSLAPKSTTTLYFLGLYYKACADEDNAQKMFKKVLELQPGHVEAEREVRLMERRKNKSGGSSRSGGGMFGLGRKKK